MGKCSKSETCSFIDDRMSNMPSIAELFKKRLCEEDNSQCARYHLHNYLEKHNYTASKEWEVRIAELSANLYPNEIDRVRQFFLSPM